MGAAFPPPDEHHAALRRLTGAWSAQIRNYETPGAPPVESAGEFLARVDLGGYFLFRQVNFGMQGYQGHGLTGWDPFEKTFVGMWADSESPVIYATRGTFDARGKVFTETTEGPDADGTLLRMLLVTDIVDDTHATFRVFRTDRGSEELQVEILLTRRRFV